MADETSKSSEEEKALVSVSVEATDILGYGKGASKLFETISPRLGQIFSGVGDFINVLFLERKRIKNEAYRTRELGSAQADAIHSQWRAISPIINSGQQVQEIAVAEGKVGAQLVGASTELLALHQRSTNRIALENTIHQHNLEAAVSYAAEELGGEQEVDPEPVEPDWVTQWSKLVQDVSSEEMQLLWGRVLAGEIKRPGSFSPRTLQFMSLLTQKEAELFRRVCAYNWRYKSNEIHLIMLPKDEQDKIPAGFSYLELQLLQTIGLVEFELAGFFSFNENHIELTYNGSKIELFKPKHIVKDYVEAGQVNLTHIGQELASICQPEYDPCIMEEAMHYWMSRGYQVSCPFFIQPPKPADVA
jgi:hypothetical protein